MKTSERMRNAKMLVWNGSIHVRVPKYTPDIIEEVALLEDVVLLHGHLPHCPQFTGPFDLGELEPACTCGYKENTNEQ